jgi:hypothetical protein
VTGGVGGLRDEVAAVTVNAAEAVKIAARISALVPALPRNHPALLFIENSTYKLV